MIDIFYFSLIPCFCMILGGIIASIYRPGPMLTSATQHFAAGVVFAAVAKELLPKLGAHNNIWVLVVGFMLGVVIMILLKEFSEKLVSKQKSKKAIPFGMLSAVGIDVFIDGVLIGIAFLVGEQGGILVAVALSMEVIFLGLSTAASLGKKGFKMPVSIIAVTLLALLIPTGSMGGAFLLKQLPYLYTTGLLAFGVAALLYLVTEELLAEAHEVEDTPWITMSFFIGFLLILIIENLSA